MRKFIILSNIWFPFAFYPALMSGMAFGSGKDLSISISLLVGGLITFPILFIFCLLISQPFYTLKKDKIGDIIRLTPYVSIIASIIGLLL